MYTRCYNLFNHRSALMSINPRSTLINDTVNFWIDKRKARSTALIWLIKCGNHGLYAWGVKVSKVWSWQEGGIVATTVFHITPVHLAWQADHLTLPEVNYCGEVSWGDISAYWTFAGRLKNCQMFYWSKYVSQRQGLALFHLSKSKSCLIYSSNH